MNEFPYCTCNDTAGPAGCWVHSQPAAPAAVPPPLIPSDAGQPIPSYTILIAEIAALRAEAERLERERDEARFEHAGLCSQVRDLMNRVGEFRAEVERLRKERDAATCSYCGRIGAAPRGQPLLARLAALERVAEAARGFRRAAKAPLGDPAGWSAQTYQAAEALFSALAALAKLDGKEKP